MTDINPEIFKGLFRQLRDQKLHDYRRQISLQLDKGDQFDRAMDERNQALMVKLKSRTSLYLKKIERALEKIDQGTFGVCEDCDQNISSERLLARPTAKLCIQCKEAEEMVENSIPYSKRSHTLGKSLITDINLNQASLGLDGGAIQPLNIMKIVNG